MPKNSGRGDHPVHYVVPVEDVPRHASSRPGRRGRAVVLVACLAVFVMLLGTGFFAVQRLQSNIKVDDLSALIGDGRPTAVPEPGDDAFSHKSLNILVMGSDSRQGDNAGYGQVEGARSDTTALVHIDKDRKGIKVVSIPRDSWVDIPSCTKPGGGTTPAQTGKFNSAFALGGPACTIKTVEKLTDIRIDDYVVIDFAGFKSMVDAIGGVQVCLAEPIQDKKASIDLPAGKQTLTGKQALGVVRSRHSTFDGSDIARIGRQQQFLAALFHNLTDAKVLTNPAKLYNFLDAATKSVTTDPDLGNLDNMRRLATSLAGMPENGVKFITVPNGDRGDGSNVLWIPSASEKLWDSIRGKHRDGTPLEKSTPKPGSTSTSGSTPTKKPTTSSTDDPATDTSSKAKDTMICSN